MKTLKEIFSEYHQSNKALPAFNIDSFEIYQAVEAVIAETKQPCIVQLSAGEDAFIQAERLLLLVKKARIDGLPIFTNMDHGKDLSRLEYLADLGFDMLHFDGSDLDYKENLQTATQFIKKVKSKNPNILIEVEFNKIKSSGTKILPESFTDPQQAQDFIKESQADLLAISIGNLHGVDLDQPEKIDLPLLEELHKQLPNQFFTLHGGSGIDHQQIKKSLDFGIVKININTDLRLQFIKSLKSSLLEQKTEKIYKLYQPVLEDLKTLIKENFYA
jgi:fructose-bisphosphate aldolase, class II